MLMNTLRRLAGLPTPSLDRSDWDVEFIRACSYEETVELQTTLRAQGRICWRQNGWWLYCKETGKYCRDDWGVFYVTNVNRNDP